MPTGIDSQLGVAVEGSYGTYEEPTDFLEFDSAGIVRQPNFLTSTALRKRPVPPVARHRETTRQAGGPLALKVPNKGLGPLLYMLHGVAATPVQQGGTSAYLQTHPVGVTRPNGKSLTMQLNKPTVEQDEPFSYVGCKFTQAVFSCETSGELMLALEVAARDALTNESLAVASYPDPISSFDFTQAEITIDGTEASAIIGGFTLTIPLPHKTERWGLGRGGVQDEPVAFNDYMRPTLELPAEFTDTELFDFYVAGDPVPIVITFTGDNISGAYDEMIRFTLPECKFVGEDPGVDGPDVLDQAGSVEIYDNGTDAPVTIAYQSVDTAILPSS